MAGAARFLAAEVIDRGGNHEKRQTRGRHPDQQVIGDQRGGCEGRRHDDAERAHDFKNTDGSALRGRHFDEEGVAAVFQRFYQLFVGNEFSPSGHKKDCGQRHLPNPNQGVHRPWTGVFPPRFSFPALCRGSHVEWQQPIEPRNRDDCQGHRRAISIQGSRLQQRSFG